MILDGGGRDIHDAVGLTGFHRKGATVGVAWDAAAGALLLTVDGAPLESLFPAGVAPGAAVGAGLFPVVSGMGGYCVRWNAGQRPFRHGPPEGFLPCAHQQVPALDTRGR